MWEGAWEFPYPPSVHQPEDTPNPLVLGFL